MFNANFYNYLSAAAEVAKSPLVEAIMKGYAICESTTVVPDIPATFETADAMPAAPGSEEVDTEATNVGGVLSDDAQGEANAPVMPNIDDEPMPDANPMADMNAVGDVPNGNIDESAPEEPEVEQEEEEETEDKPNVAVDMWPGDGYNLITTEVYSPSGTNDAMGAIETAVAKIEKEGDPNNLLLDVAETEKQGIEDGTYDPNSDEGNPVFDETYLYVDATMDGATKPYYILAENLKVRDI